MKRVPLALVLAAALSAGCRDAIQPPATGGPMALIMDGAHSGNSFFFFLPPLVPNPNSFFHAGKFNPGLSPVVEVCELTGDPRVLAGADCKDLTRVFGPARMTLDQSNQQYQLNWDTKTSPLSADKFYRILVRGAARGKTLGFVDVDPVDQGMKNVRTGDVVPFQDGRTLPIKVRIEDGAFGSTSDDHVERVVPASIPGGTLDITTNTGFAGARFSNGWLPDGIDQVVVTIDRIAVNNGSDETSCLESGLEELEGCYRFRTDPDLHGLGSDGEDLLFFPPVIAGVCFEIPNAAGNPDAPPFALHRREEGVEGFSGPAVELEDVPAPFLRCAGFGQSQLSVRGALRSGRLSDVARAAWGTVVRGIAHLVAPRALYAIDAGAGGSSNEFSRFGWARHSTMAITAGDGATAPAGSVITASVHLQTAHHENHPPVVDQAVTFTVTGGGGSLVAEPEVTTLSVSTDESGNASVSWRLGIGTNTLRVETVHVTDSPLIITATGTAPAAGSLIDPAGDAGSGADVVSATGTVAGGNLTLSARFARTTYNASTFVVWNLDTDQNTATGFPGITNTNADAALLGVDFIVQIRGTAFGSTVTVLRGNLTVVSTTLTPTFVANGVDVTIPLSLLDGDDGVMNYKATIQTQLTAGSWSGINDFISNLGSPVGTVSP